MQECKEKIVAKPVSILGDPYSDPFLLKKLKNTTLEEHYVRKPLSEEDYEKKYELIRTGGIRSSEYYVIKYDAMKGYGLKCHICEEKSLNKLAFHYLYYDGKFHRRMIGVKSGEVLFYIWITKNEYPKDMGLLLCCKLHKKEFEILSLFHMEI